ncbi:MAG: hypothetical protein HQL27_07290 [Candidatus Omnitrophica bacterium]|nr:hypothetical protein [Candidatus Omnitrophota bacterium]
MTKPLWMAPVVFIRDVSNFICNTLFGYFIIGYFLLYGQKGQKSRQFYFSLWWVIIILVLNSLIGKWLFWIIAQESLGRLRYVNLSRIALLLPLFGPIMFGISCEFLIQKYKPPDRKFWLLFILGVLICLLAVPGAQESPAEKASFLLSIMVFVAFIILFILRSKQKINIPVVLVILIPLLFYSSVKTIVSRFAHGIHNYFHFFRSDDADKIKDIEKGNMANFRVAKAGNPEPSQLLYHGFQCVDGYYNLYPKAYSEFWEKVVEPEFKRSSDLREYLALGGNSRVYLWDWAPDATINKLNFNLDLLKLINVKYLFSDRPITQHEKYGLIQVIDKDPNYVKLPQWKKYFKKGVFYVYQNKEFAPQIFLTDSYVAFDKKEELLKGLGENSFDYLVKHSFVFSRDSGKIPQNGMDVTNAKIIDLRLTPDKVTLEVDNEYPAILNWTRNYNKNWVCKVKGKNVEAFKVYNSFIGVALPSRAGRVEFIYRNIYFEYALYFGIFWLFLTVFFIIKFLKETTVSKP